MTSALPFDDFRQLIGNLPHGDRAKGEAVRDVFARSEKPSGSLGRVEDLAAWLAEWSGKAPPIVLRPQVAVFAGNHGVAVARSISPRPVEATARKVELCAAGGAAINQICIANDIGLKVFDLALHLPTADFTIEPALDERGCAATMAFGMEAIAGGTDLMCIGDMGVGNSTVAAALSAAVCGGKGKDWVGEGSGADGAMQARKAEAVDAALKLHAAHLSDPLEVLRRLGGREFAAIAGAILAARMERIPVILDGYATTAAAAILHTANPTALDHCLLAQITTEPGHARLVDELGLEPLFDFNMAHGEAAGAALAAGVVKASAMVASGLAAALRR